MLFRTLLLLSIILISEPSYCNTETEIAIPQTALINKLLLSGKSADIHIPLSIQIDAINRPLNVAFLKNKSKLYLKVDGTGFLYLYDTTISGFCHFKRIDKTSFIGYNFGEFPFFKRHHLLSRRVWLLVYKWEPQKILIWKC